MPDELYIDRSIDKDPQAELDYKFDWSAWLSSMGDSDTISSSTWTVPAGITKGATSNTTTITTVWLSGGTDGAVYNVVNRIVTAAGRTEERTLVVRVRQR